MPNASLKCCITCRDGDMPQWKPIYRLASLWNPHPLFMDTKSFGKNPRTCLVEDLATAFHQQCSNGGRTRQNQQSRVNLSFPGRSERSDEGTWSLVKRDLVKRINTTSNVNKPQARFLLQSFCSGSQELLGACLLLLLHRKQGLPCKQPNGYLEYIMHPFVVKRRCYCPHPRHHDRSCPKLNAKEVDSYELGQL